MKTIKKLKLDHLCENELDVNQQDLLRGGNVVCGCGCGNCVCNSWGGTGSIPPGQNSSDHGNGSINANLSATRDHGM